MRQVDKHPSLPGGVDLRLGARGGHLHRRDVDVVDSGRRVNCLEELHGDVPPRVASSELRGLGGVKPHHSVAEQACPARGLVDSLLQGAKLVDEPELQGLTPQVDPRLEELLPRRLEPGAPALLHR